jgi:hypothetical protein
MTTIRFGVRKELPPHITVPPTLLAFAAEVIE